MSKFPLIYVPYLSPVDAQVSLQSIPNVTEGSTFNVSIDLETSGTLDCDLVVTLLAIPGTATGEKQGY